MAAFAKRIVIVLLAIARSTTTREEGGLGSKTPNSGWLPLRVRFTPG